MILKGKTPPGTADLLKQMLKQSNSDFNQVQKMSYMTTSSGRHYRKQQFERLIKLV